MNLTYGILLGLAAGFFSGQHLHLKWRDKPKGKKGKK